MSRRKQAKPRALKRDEMEDDEDSKEDQHATTEDRTTPNGDKESLGQVDKEGPETRDSYRCETCGLRLDNLQAFLDHRNFECSAGLNGGFGTPTSWRSSDTPDDQSTSMSPTSCATPSDPDADLTYTIGVTESTPYACQFCDKAFPRLSYLKRHEQVHSDQMPFKCDYCQRLFKHKRSRDRHVKLHTGDRKYRCPHCESAFSRSDHLKIHMKTHDNAKPFQCTVCNRGYNTAAALTSHMQNHKREQPTDGSNSAQTFRCLQCSLVFTTARDLQVHVGSHGDGSSSPAFLPQLSPSPIVRHQGEAVDVQGKCGVCEVIFPSPEALALHKKVHEDVVMTDVNGVREESNASTKFACGFCSQCDFSNLESLQLHVQAYHVPITSSGDTPTSPSQLPSILLSQHPPSSSSDFDCDYCTMKFGTVHALQKHTLTIHSFCDIISKCRENVYCSQCTMGFNSPSALLDHVRSMHERDASSGTPITQVSKTEGNKVGKNRLVMPKTEPSSYNGTTSHEFPSPHTLLCNQCNAAFSDFESFRTHLKTHLDAVKQKFTCTECDGEFTTEDQLDSHVTSHYLSTSTEYGCQCCLKLFNKPDELQKHLMDIHAHHLYRCALCKEMFDSKVSIQVHFAVKHSNECRLFKCTSCNAVFRSDVEFQLHVRVSHLSKLQPFRCLLCDQCFPTELQLQYHVSTHKKQFSCALCGEAFHVEFLLDKHMQTVHTTDVAMLSTSSRMSNGTAEVAQNLSLKSRNRNDNTSDSSAKKEIRCDICDASFPSESSLNSHRRHMHNIRTSGSQKSGQATLSLFCAYCNESCKSRTELENHMKAHTVSPSKHKCNICDELCPSASVLAEHKLTHCKVVYGSTCVNCRMAMQSEEQFYTHIQQHNNHGFPLPCVVCRQTLISDVEVRLHARFHLKNNENLYSCCVCTRHYEVNHLIITGKQDGVHTYMCKDCFHSKTDDLRCQECHVKFENITELEKHRVTHRKTYQCIKCQMSFDTEAEIQVHVTTHVLQEGTCHECRLCHKVLDSPAKLQCHLIEHTFEGCSTYTCYICSSVFTAPHLLQIHMLDHGLTARPYDCSRCPQKFFFRAELENHILLHTEFEGATDQFQCMDCSKVFNTVINLNNHRKIHEQKGNTYKCSLCPEVFQTSADMQQHHFRCHSDTDLQEGKKCFPCTECEQVFPCLSNLQGHMRIHTQGTKYTCPQCNKEFALSRNLNIHMRSHSGEKPYECPICKKRFARKENRKAHLKSHTGLKPFMCPHCGKTFSRKCHVKEHMRIHISSTTNPCEMCSESFPSMRRLRKHMMEVHQKQYEHICTICGDIFESSQNLDNHLSKSHDVTIAHVDDPPPDDLSESSPGQSSTSGDAKDLESSECSSLPEEGDMRDSPVSVNEENVAVPPPEVAA